MFAVAASPYISIGGEEVEWKEIVATGDCVGGCWGEMTRSLMELLGQGLCWKMCTVSYICSHSKFLLEVLVALRCREVHVEDFMFFCF